MNIEQNIEYHACNIARHIPPWECIDVDDLKQEARLALLRGRKSFNGPMLDFVRSWTQHRVTNKRKRYTGELKPNKISCGPTQEDDIHRKDLEREMGRVIGRLPERQQVMLRLLYWDELKACQVGDIIGVSQSRVSQLHDEALAKLKKMIDRSRIC